MRQSLTSTLWPRGERGLPHSCDHGNLMPVPNKPIPVIHTYTTSKPTRIQLMGTGAGQCYKYDGVEGYVAPSNLGGLQELIQLYNPTADSYILVPSSKVSLANGIGYTQQQTLLGWVVPY